MGYSDTFLKRKSFTRPCSSWFKCGSKDRKPAVYPGSCLHFLRLLEHPRYEDYEFKYDKPEDLFQFFGSGFHISESNGADITWYLGKLEKEVDEAKVQEVMDRLKGLGIKGSESSKTLIALARN